MPAKPRLIAFYLPQYHPTPENDAWWGKGFTEWTNVVRGRPLFPGHYQPHLPADLGFYDLRLPEARQAQADLARAYSLSGFCYYHYWFHGQRLLERPFNEVLASGQPDFPFCLCWANHHWNRVWDGQTNELLIRQEYSAEDDLEHIRWLALAFRDQRYIRIDGKPVFIVYHASALPNPAATAALWRDEARRLGIGELYLCKVDSFQDHFTPPAQIGFDAAVGFQPDTASLLTLPEKAYWRVARKLGLGQGALVCDYAQFIRRSLRQEPRPYLRFPCVTPGWDNSARRKSGAFLLHRSTPQLYGQWLRDVIRQFTPVTPEANLVFVNAWNEWAEGNHLEPCQKWGRAYLEATRQAIMELS